MMAQDLPRDRAGGYAPNRFTSTGATAPGDGTHAELRIIRVVGVAGTIRCLHLGVGLGPLVLIAHKDTDGGAQRLAVEYPGENLGAIAFLPLSDDAALPWAP